MLAQIDKNNDSNAQLAQQVTALRTEISDSKKDISLIEEYLLSTGRKVAKAQEMGRPPRGLSRKGPTKELFSSLSGSNRLLRVRSPGRLG